MLVTAALARGKLYRGSFFEGNFIPRTFFRFLFPYRIFSRKNYTVAIFKDNWPTYTAAVFETANVPLKPLLKPGQFTVVGEVDDTHEGEVFSHEEDTLQELNNTRYHTISEEDVQYSLEHPIPESSVHSYFPLDSQESMTVSYSNFSGYPESSANFSGYPDSLHPISSVSITESSWQLSGGDNAATNSSSTNQIEVKLKPDTLFTKFYIGHKLWYSGILFAIYQTVITLVYLLSLLAKHYTQFPAALQAVTSSNSET